MQQLEEFARYYREPGLAARAWKARGGITVGWVGAGVPLEVLVAAGVLPVRVSGDPASDLELADRYMERELDPLSRSQFSRLLGGAYPFLDYLVIANDCEGSLRLFYYLREIQRVEPRASLPDFHCFDPRYLPFRTSAVYNRARVRELREQLERWTGVTVTDADLRAAVALLNENRRLLQRVAALRTEDPPRLTGVQALQIIGAGMAMPTADHSLLLRSLLDEAEQLPRLSRRVRVFLTGSAHDHLQFYELLEARGAVVVGEDHDWGNRFFADLVEPSGDPLDGIVDRCQFGAPLASRSASAERAAYTAGQARAAGAEVVICFVRMGDEAPAWDYPEQRQRLAEHGIQIPLLARQPYALADTAGLERQLDKFLASARRGREGAGT